MKEIIGKIIEVNDSNYRVIFVDDKFVYLIKMDVEYVDINTIKLDMFNKLMTVIEPKLDTKPNIDINNLNDSMRQKYDKALNIIKDVEALYGPNYIKLKTNKKNGIINKLSKKYNVSVKSIWKYIRRYLQSGFNTNSLIDERKNNGHNRNKNSMTKIGSKNKYGASSKVVLTDLDKKCIDKLIRNNKDKNKMNFTYLYQQFLNSNYSEFIEDANAQQWVEKEKRPSYRQFRYYVKNILSKKDTDERKTNKLEVLNNKRVLTSSSRINAIRPGWIVECDAVEVDLSIVSELDNQITIGRPIMYVMVDVLTSCIIAVSVSLENNSIIGLTNLFLNLADNKYELCKNHGLVIDEKTWPSNIIPHEIRCDRGSDFVSEKFKEICCGLGISLSYMSPGVGSFKGIVEQSFHQFHESIKPTISSYGYISKRHDSKHHQHAMLTMSKFRKMVYNYVIYHNMKSITDYPMSREMIEKENFLAIPYILWEHYVKEVGPSRPINDQNKNDFLYKIMLPGNAKISRRGVVFKELCYMTTDESLVTKMYDAGNKRKTFPIKYDPRSTSKLYCIDKNEIKILDLNKGILNQSDFLDMTWNEYEEYRKKRKKIRHDSQDYSLELNAQLRMNFDHIIKESMNDTLPYTKNIIENRRNEKHKINRANAIKLDVDKEEYLENTNVIDNKFDILKDNNKTIAEELEFLMKYMVG